MKHLSYSKMILVIMFFASLNVFGQAPRTLTYQGKLSDAGVPVNGNRSLTFSIYDTSIGGVALWSESFPSIVVSNGIFSVILGKSTPLSFQLDQTLWIGTKVGTDPEISPRVELTGNLYALKLALPYIDTISSAPAGSNLFRLVYDGTGPENVGVAHFENLNPENNFSAIYARTFGTNGAADMFIINPTNTNNVIDAQTNGLGSAGNFRILNASNDTSAFVARTNGTGEAIYGLNTGTGRAGHFQTTNATNTAPTVQVTSNSAAAPALKIAHSGSGNAIEISSGGIHYNVINVTDAASPITVRSVVYNVTVPGMFTLNWTTPPKDGDMIYVWNDYYSQIEFAGHYLTGYSLATLLFIGGSWRLA